MNEIFVNSKWIWAEDNTKRGDVIVVRRAFKLDKPPKTATLRVAAESRYSLWVNGKSAVHDGGLARESRPGCGYYDEVDITKMLTKGENVIGAEVIRDSVAGDNTSDSGFSGFIFECPECNVYSDSSCLVFRDGAYVESQPSLPSGNISGSNIRYDATRESMLTGYRNADFSSNIFEPATEYGDYGCEPWGELVRRPIAMFVGEFVPKVRRVVRESNRFAGDRYTDVYTVNLPRAMHVYPYLSVSGNSGEKIEVRTDCYTSHGCYSHADKEFNGFRLEYIMKAEAQEYESPQCLFGEKLLFYIPPTVKVSALGYRESVYDSEAVGHFVTDSEFMNTLIEKSENTLYACMRSSLINNPDRDSMAMPAAAGVGAECAFYHLDENAVKLAEKTLRDFITFIDKDVIYANPTGNKFESPSQTLIALSEFGLSARYFDYVGACELISEVALASLRYLAGWNMASDGFIEPKEGKCDELYNGDDKLIINFLYLSALKNTLRISESIGENSQSDFLKARIEDLSRALKNCFDGIGYTTVKGRYDDRANALAVLCKVADEDEISVVEILASCHNATPLYEGFILEALCKMGRGDIAYDRMCTRYYGMVEAESSTLHEDFASNGSICSLASAKPLGIVYRCFAGIVFEDGCKKITITPDLRRLNVLDFCSELRSGRLRGKIQYRDGRVEAIVENGTNAEVTLVLKADRLRADLQGQDARVVKLGKGKNKFTL